MPKKMAFNNVPSANQNVETRLEISTNGGACFAIMPDCIELGNITESTAVTKTPQICIGSDGRPVVIGYTTDYAGFGIRQTIQLTLRPSTYDAIRSYTNGCDFVLRLVYLCDGKAERIITLNNVAYSTKEHQNVQRKINPAGSDPLMVITFEYDGNPILTDIGTTTVTRIQVPPQYGMVLGLHQCGGILCGGDSASCQGGCGKNGENVGECDSWTIVTATTNGFHIGTTTDGGKNITWSSEVTDYGQAIDSVCCDGKVKVITQEYVLVYKGSDCEVIWLGGTNGIQPVTAGNGTIFLHSNNSISLWSEQGQSFELLRDDNAMMPIQELFETSSCDEACRFISAGDATALSSAIVYQYSTNGGENIVSSALVWYINGIATPTATDKIRALSFVNNSFVAVVESAGKIYVLHSANGVLGTWEVSLTIPAPVSPVDVNFWNGNGISYLKVDCALHRNTSNLCSCDWEKNFLTLKSCDGVVAACEAQPNKIVHAYSVA